MASILVIEDVPAVLLSLRIVLQGKGHQVTGAANGTRGLDLLASAAFDLVITDIWMPGSSGTEVIAKGRERSPRTRFLAITGGDPNVSGPQDALRRQDFGADAVLLKPFEKEELLSAVSLLVPGSVV
ncbi:MAG: response regulator [Xanthobacteraceae bacterium]|jgi:CheY-like chemotaxis protein